MKKAAHLVRGFAVPQRSPGLSPMLTISYSSCAIGAVVTVGTHLNNTVNPTVGGYSVELIWKQMGGKDAPLGVYLQPVTHPLGCLDARSIPNADRVSSTAELSLPGAAEPPR